MNTDQKAGLERLIAAAHSGTGQSRRVADFLLAWWNAAECGGFDLTNLWSLDETLVADVVTVFAFIAQVKAYPDSLDFVTSFASILKDWRPELQAA